MAVEEADDAPRSVAYWYRDGLLSISNHALWRIKERCREHFERDPLKAIAPLCARAIYQGLGAVVLPVEMDPHNRQIAIPFEYANATQGWLVLTRDRESPGQVVCKTFLEPDSWQLQVEVTLIEPSWYIEFRHQVKQEEAEPEEIEPAEVPAPEPEEDQPPDPFLLPEVDTDSTPVPTAASEEPSLEDFLESLPTVADVHRKTVKKKTKKWHKGFKEGVAFVLERIREQLESFEKK